MKPLEIRMQAFGPYLAETTVDFASLYKNGLFLITGPTGSGKTSILDAMSFALYGRATGSVRDARDMRSTAAADAMETSVCYEFALGEERYRFERGIRIHIRKLRAGGTGRDVDYTAACFRLEGEKWRLLCEGTNDVSAAAKDLLGFSCEQFNQVVVLPQGEFRRLLTASSAEKQKILEALFGTGRWQAFMQKLNDRVRASRQKLDLLAERRAALLSGADAESEEALRADAEAAGRELENIKKQLEEEAAALASMNEEYARGNALAAQFAELDRMRARKAALAAREGEMESLRRRLEKARCAEAVLPFFRAAKAAENELAAAAEALNQAEAARASAAQAEADAEKAAERVDGLRRKTTDCVAALSRLEEAEKAAAALAEKKEALAAAQAERERAQAEFRRLEKSLAETETEEKRLGGEAERLFNEKILPLPQIAARKAELAAAADTLERKRNAQSAADELDRLVAEKLAEYREAKARLDEKTARLRELEDALSKDRAFALSLTLEEEKPCPVCGATRHPAPAKPCENGADEKAVAAQKKRVEDERASLDKIREAGAELRAKQQEAKRRLGELEKSLSSAKTDETAVKRELAESSAALKECGAAKERYGALQKRLAAMKGQSEAGRAALERARRAQADAQNRAASLGGSLSQMRQGIPQELQDPEAIARRKRETAAASKAAGDEIEALTRALSAARENRSAAAARADEAAAHLDTARKRREQALSEYREKCAALDFPAARSPEEFLLGGEEAAQNEKTLADYTGEREAAERRAGELSQVLLNVPRPELSRLQKEQEALRVKTDALAARRGGVEQSLASRRAALRSLSKTRREEEEEKARFELASRLSRLTNSDNPQKTPIHQFVLGLMLDDIVASANRRLSRLTRGRYALTRSSEPLRGGGSKGLDLMVSDAWRGGERSVNTLSGGEMFLASLSLAFGLSDVVQAYAGGIRLDSIFIDEGFGTLDSETLETAMRALQELRRAGRLVGVISHLSELKDRIPSRIEVSRASDGTSLVRVSAESVSL